MPVGGGVGGVGPIDTFDLSSPDSASTFASSDWSRIPPAVTPPSFQPNGASFAIIPPAFDVLQHQGVPELTHLAVHMDASSLQAASTDSWLLSYSPPINSSSLAPSPASSQQVTYAAAPKGSPPGASLSTSQTKITFSFVPSNFPLKSEYHLTNVAGPSHAVARRCPATWKDANECSKTHPTWNVTFSLCIPIFAATRTPPSSARTNGVGASSVADARTTFCDTSAIRGFEHCTLRVPRNSSIRDCAAWTPR